MRRKIALASFSIALLAPAAASATATFPDAVKTDLSLSYLPPCTVCHATLAGGTGTVTQSFGKSLRQNGLQSGNTDSLSAALTALETAKTDSDCDGVNDIDQMKEGRDPNTGAYIDGSGKAAPGGAGCGGGTGDAEPAYGCGAQLAGPAVGSAWATAAALATLLGLALARGRRRT